MSDTQNSKENTKPQATSNNSKSILNSLASQFKKQTIEPSKIKTQYKFWDTQPVPKLTDDATIGSGVIQEADFNNTSRIPATLPAPFEWCTLDLKDPNDMNELSNLIEKNYVQSSEGSFTPVYSVERIKWYLVLRDYFVIILFQVFDASWIYKGVSSWRSCFNHKALGCIYGQCSDEYSSFRHVWFFHFNDFPYI